MRTSDADRTDFANRIGRRRCDGRCGRATISASLTRSGPLLRAYVARSPAVFRARMSQTVRAGGRARWTHRHAGYLDGGHPISRGKAIDRALTQLYGEQSLAIDVESTPVLVNTCNTLRGRSAVGSRGLGPACGIAHRGRVRTVEHDLSRDHPRERRPRRGSGRAGLVAVQHGGDGARWPSAHRRRRPAQRRGRRGVRAATCHDVTGRNPIWAWGTSAGPSFVFKRTE